MKRWCLLIALYLTVSFISGCAKPDHVTTVKSPTEGVFYTVETFNGHGAADSDFTRVYAHLERNGESDKKLVVDGGYLEIARARLVEHLALAGPQEGDDDQHHR